MNAVVAQFGRFLIVGLVSNLLNFLVYASAYGIGISILIASVAGYLVGLLTSFHFGKLWVFAADGRVPSLAGVRFLVVYGIGGFGMTMIIDSLNTALAWDYRICWVCGASFAVANNFLGSKWLVFHSAEARNGR